MSDAGWERMAPLIIDRPGKRASTGRDNRMFVERVLKLKQFCRVPIRFAKTARNDRAVVTPAAIS